MGFLVSSLKIAAVWTRLRCWPWTGDQRNVKQISFLIFTGLVTESPVTALILTNLCQSITQTHLSCEFCVDWHDFCLSDCRGARKGATEAGGGETAGQRRPEESQGGAGAKNLQSRCWKIHQPCHNVRNTREYRLLQFPCAFDAEMTHSCAPARLWKLQTRVKERFFPLRWQNLH